MKKDRYELLRKNIQRVELTSLTGQTWLDSYGSLVPWSGSNHSSSIYIGPEINDIVDNITGSVPKGYYKWGGTSWTKITGATNHDISGSVYGSYQFPLFLDDSLDEMGVMVGIADVNGDSYMEQIEQLVNFHYTQTGSFVKVFSTTNPDKLRNIIDQEYKIYWGHNNATSSLAINNGVVGTNFPTASYTYPTTPNTYTISLSLNSPWNKEKISKKITIPQFTGTPQNILGSITGITVPYSDPITGQTLNYLNDLDYTDNYGPVTVSGSMFKYSAFGKSKITDFNIYGGGINSSSFTYSTSGETSQWTGYTFTYTGSFISGTSYNMVTLHYRDYDDGITTITGTTTGFTREEVFNEALTRNEHFLGFIDEPSIYSDIFVERGKQGVLEKTHRLGEVDSVGELDIYGNGYFKVRKQ
jgi:hypothetical protein